MLPKTGETVPSHCPACGTRITCPRCGSSFGYHDRKTVALHCSVCNVDFDLVETRPLDARPKVEGHEALAIPGFDVGAELGRGGMGIVYRAYQRSLRRDVAVKVLPPPMALNTSLLERFRNEAAIAAGLVDSHILPVFAIEEAQGVPIIVMPLVEGSDLGQILRDRLRVKQKQAPAQSHPWALLDDRAYLNKMLPLLDQVIAAVAALHRRGILHRDIKPSNVLVDQQGNGWLSDFGLARLKDSGVGTEPGLFIGTHGYAAPEQARGDKDIDYRADIFSLAATIYQALTLELPYGKQATTATSGIPLPPTRRAGFVPAEFDPVLLKALEIDPARRYDSSAPFQEDWIRARKGILPLAPSIGRMRRFLHGVRRYRTQVITGLVMALLLVVLSTVFILNSSTAKHVDPAEGRLPGEVPPAPETTSFATVSLTTEPAGARVALVPIHPLTGFPLPDRAIRPENRTPLRLEKVPVGEYLVIAAIEGRGFHEVYRTVPRPNQLEGKVGSHQHWDRQADGTVAFRTITIHGREIMKGMTQFPQGDFIMGGDEQPGMPPRPPHSVHVEAFYLDSTEVTVNELLKHYKPVSALAQLLPSDPSHAAVGVSFDEALSYAEQIGKRLPDEFEYEYAATRRGKSRFPWGDDAGKIVEWKFGPVGLPAYDRTSDDPPVYGLFSNTAEWTSSWATPYYGMDADQVARFYQPEMQAIFLDARIVRGGPISVIEGKPDPKNDRRSDWNPRDRNGVGRNERKAGLGFRCARSAEPRFLTP